MNTIMNTAMNTIYSDMLAGRWYNGMDPELLKLRRSSREWLRRFNAAFPGSAEADALLRQGLGATGAGVWVEPPLFCDYGRAPDVGRGFHHQAQFRDFVVDSDIVAVHRAGKTALRAQAGVPRRESRPESTSPSKSQPRHPD